MRPPPLAVMLALAFAPREAAAQSVVAEAGAALAAPSWVSGSLALPAGPAALAPSLTPALDLTPALAPALPAERVRGAFEGFWSRPMAAADENVQGRIHDVRAALAWTDERFTAADGTQIHYRLRRGTGPGIVLLHGHLVGSELFERVTSVLFPGRAMVVMDRRGYAPSGPAQAAPETVGALNAGDVAQALRIAAKVGGTRKAAVVAVSLGALLLPPLDADDVAWLALVSPGAPRLARYMEPVDQQAALATQLTYENSRYWFPAARRAWLASMSHYLVNDFAKRARANAGAANAAVAEGWIARAESRLQDPQWTELFVQESLYAGFGDAAVPVSPAVPVFAVFAQGDEIVPAGASEALRASLASRGTRVTVLSVAGGHLSPLLDPSLFAPRLEAFERALRP